MSSAEIPQPHDGLIRFTFGSPENATSLLQAYLPGAVVNLLHWPGLELQSGSYVDPELRQCESDLLYRVPVREGHEGGRGTDVYFHILLEHQSSPDVELRYRLLSYEVEILRRLRKERGRLEKAPVILPLVIAQVAGGWRISPQYADFVDWPERGRSALEAYVPRFEHLLIDLARETPEGLRGNAEVRLALGLLKASAEKRLMEWLEWGMALMRLVHSPEMLQVLFRYLASMESGINLKTVAEKVRSQRLPQAENVIMTIADELKAEGREEARAEFLTIADELKAEGREEARAEFLTIADELKAEGREEARAELLTIADELKAEGRNEGRNEGRIEGEKRGVLIGAVQTLERLLGRAETPVASFSERSLGDLQAQIEALDEEVRVRLSR